MSDDDLEREVEAVSRLLGVQRDSHHGALQFVTPNDRRTIATDAMVLLAIGVDQLGGNVSGVVRLALGTWARRLAVAGFFDAMADQHALSTDVGVNYAALALKHQNAAWKAMREATALHKLTVKTGPVDHIARIRAEAEARRKQTP